jgi:uncharacterized membrane protein
VPAALILLSAPLVLASVIRLVTLASGADITPENARFFAAPLPVVLHVVGASVFLVLGAFQFVPAIRRNRPGWHRRAGRLLVVAGLVAALSGLWMTLLYPLPASDGDLLKAFRVLFGSAMVGSIVLGFIAIRRRQVARHRAWMIRGYAIGMGAGTQLLTLGFGQLFVGTPSVDARALLMGAAWAINLAVAEWIIRGRPLGPFRARPTAVSTARGRSVPVPD